MSSLVVNVGQDKKEGLWYVVSSDVPGLNAEAETLDGLVEIIGDLAPDLIAANLKGMAANTPVCIQHILGRKTAHAA
ncbi:MAG: DUF1902 domain-containing protein [Rhizobiales bacterium]|nr:DUF1902 domain-containing protein [Hyphomicrobiales bacterium]MBI3673728.1 DUF1902 domain-containing protein [Hyphomicrobiales bacterium]